MIHAKHRFDSVVEELVAGLEDGSIELPNLAGTIVSNQEALRRELGEVRSELHTVNEELRAIRALALEIKTSLEQRTEANGTPAPAQVAKTQ
jgi:hypothetical protein